MTMFFPQLALFSRMMSQIFVVNLKLGCVSMHLYISDTIYEPWNCGFIDVSLV